MKVGIQLPHFGPHASGEGAVALGVEAERLGFDSVWVGDHVVYPAELVDRFGPAVYDPLVTLAWIGARTTRVALGTAVLVLPYHNPLRLAKALGTLERLAGRRLVVGVGAGWMEAEFAALGASFAERGPFTDEAIRVLRTLWTEPRPAFEGRFFRFPPMNAEPRPTAPPPIWVGGTTRRALRRAAELGDGWLPIWHPPTGRGLAPDTLQAAVADLRRAAARAGRSNVPTVAGVMPLAMVDAPAAAPAEGIFPVPVGPAPAIAATLGRYGAAGLEHVIVNPYYGIPPALMPESLGACGRLLERFARDVLPLLAPRA
jgi:probable F420-dependent oxidoreductase